MAKVIEENVVIRLSKLIKDDDNENDNIVTDSIKDTLEEATAQLVNNPLVVVEILTQLED